MRQYFQSKPFFVHDEILSYVYDCHVCVLPLVLLFSPDSEQPNCLLKQTSELWKLHYIK